LLAIQILSFFKKGLNGVAKLLHLINI